MRRESTVPHWAISFGGSCFIMWSSIDAQTMRLIVQMKRLARCRAGEYGTHATRSGSGVNCLPCGVTVLSHVDAAGDVVALNDHLEGPGNVVSWNLHIAMELDLVGVNH